MKFLVLFLIALGLNAQRVVASGQINTVSGDGRTMVTTTGAQTVGHAVVIDANGNHIDSGSAPSGGGAVAPATVNLYKGNNTLNGIIPAVPGVDYLVPGTGAFLATGQTGATPATPAAGNTSLFFPTTGGPGGVDASGNVYAMPSVSILSLAPNTFWSGPSSGGAAAPTARAILGVDLPLPSASTLGGIQSKAAVTNQWIKSISTAGVVATTQPDFSDLSGTATGAQLPNPSASTLGGVQSKAVVASQWINTISTAGVPGSTQPASTDLSDAATLGKLAGTQTFSAVNTFSQAGGTATPAINVTGSGASGSIMRVGPLEFQPQATTGNTTIGDNIYYNGTNFVYRAAGSNFGNLIYFSQNDMQFRQAPAGSSGATASLPISFKLSQGGSAGLGGSINTSLGAFSGSAIFTDGTKVAVGRTSSLPSLFSVGASSQFQVDTSGNTLAPTMTLTNTAAATCAVGIRGQFQYTAGGAGVKDIVEVCAKDAADAYAWRPIY